MSEPSEGIFATCFSRSINEEHLIMLTRGGGDGDVCGGGVVGGRGSDRGASMIKIAVTGSSHSSLRRQVQPISSCRTLTEPSENPPPFPSGNRNQGAAPGHSPHWISSGSAFQKMGHGPQTNTNTCFYSRDGGLVDTVTRTRGKRVRLTE